jgi:hypothetical protein
MKYRVKTPTVYGVNFNSPNLGRRINDPKRFGWLKPAERIAIKRKWSRTNHRNVLYVNRTTLNALVNKANSASNAHETLKALQEAGYGVRYDNANYFNSQVNAKFRAPAPAPKPSPAKYTFANAKKHLNQFSTSGKAVRGHQYSLVWRGMPMAQRKVLMHWRNKGEWLANNAFENKGKPPIKRKSVAKPSPPKPSPPKSASPETKRKTQLVSNFEKYWTALSSENRQILRNWNASQFKSLSPNSKKLAPFFEPANELKKKIFGSPSPNKKSASPVKNLNAAKRNVNALKTAKARKEYRRTRAVNMTQNNWTELGKYIERKNAEASRVREAKRAAKSVK